MRRGPSPPENCASDHDKQACLFQNLTDSTLTHHIKPKTTKIILAILLKRIVIQGRFLWSYPPIDDENIQVIFYKQWDQLLRLESCLQVVLSRGEAEDSILNIDTVLLTMLRKRVHDNPAHSKLGCCER